MIVPFLSLGINVALQTTKYSYITTENLLRFLTYPQTMFVIVLDIVIVSLYMLMETAALLFFYEDCKNNRTHSVLQLVIAGAKSLCSLLRRRCYLVFVYNVCLTMFFHVPLIILLLTETGVPLYLIKSLLSVPYAKIILTIAILIVLVLCYRRLFVLALCILDKKSYEEAKQTSNTFVKENHKGLISTFLGINIVLLVAYTLIYMVCFGVLVAAIHLFADKKIAISLFLHNYEQLNRIVFSCASMIGVVVNFALISNLYVRASEANIKEYEVIVDESHHKTKIQLHLHMQKRIKHSAIMLVSLCTLTAYSYFYNIIQNGSFRAEQSILGIQITAHRGNSSMAPENTIAAIQSAIDCFSDYAEIDVQLTKDGEVVLCHDSNLYRTGRVRKKVSSLTYEELLQYDVGMWFSEEYEGTTIPTLEEVLQVCKGNIKLNIEMKRIPKQKELVEKVVALIEEYEFERQCVVSSMSYEALGYVKEQNSDIRTGYILSIAYGNYLDNDNIDFISMKASAVTEDIVKRAHVLGKEVHVWTVNDRNEMTRLEALGVDNIITDRPVYAQTILNGMGDTSLLQYIKLLFQ